MSGFNFDRDKKRKIPFVYITWVISTLFAILSAAFVMWVIVTIMRHFGLV